MPVYSTLSSNYTPCFILTITQNSCLPKSLNLTHVFYPFLPILKLLQTQIVICSYYHCLKTKFIEIFCANSAQIAETFTHCTSTVQTTIKGIIRISYKVLFVKQNFHASFRMVLSLNLKMPFIFTYNSFLYLQSYQSSGEKNIISVVLFQETANGVKLMIELEPRYMHLF